MGDRAKCTIMFEPNAVVKDLSNIAQRPAESKTLQCPNCDYSISSDWFFVHPRTGICKVLTPSSGHSACRKKIGRVCHFRVLDGPAHMLDIRSNVEFCEHQKMKSQCAACGGNRMCEHGKQRHSCKLCRH